MRTRRILLAVITFAAVLSSFSATAQKAAATPGDPRAVYIVVLNHGRGAEPDFTQAGAKQLARWADRVVLELPPPALAALQKHGRVKYIQHLTSGGSAAEASAVTSTPVHAATTAAVARPMTGAGGTLTWNTGDYHYDGSGNIDKIGADDGGYTRRYKYDELDRLVEAGLEAPGAAAGAYSNYSKYTYDSFGNRLTERTPAVNSTLTANPATNHVSMQGTTISYDGVGNMTQGGGFFYQYDPFNNVKEIDGGGGIQKMSIYDANDERVIVCGNGSSGPCHWTLRGVQNEVLREYESGPITGSMSSYTYYLWSEDYIYRGAQIAGAQREVAEGGRLFFHLDHLGSPRLITNMDAQQIEKNEFAPFGREITSVTQEASLGYEADTRRFTGHERDFVEGVTDTANFVDYMHARTYSAALGRFLSVDPKIDPKSAGLELQKWNRYAYVQNRVNQYVDLTGRDALAVFLTGDENNRHVSTWKVIFNRDTVSDVKKAWRDYIGEPANRAEAYMYGAIIGGSYAGIGGARLLTWAGLSTAAAGGVTVTAANLSVIEEHLGSLEASQANVAMVDRLRNALSSGNALAGADLNFYLHELAESNLVRQGIDQGTAHKMVLEQQGVSPFSLYAPEVIERYFEEFNENWLKYLEHQGR